MTTWPFIRLVGFSHGVGTHPRRGDADKVSYVRVTEIREVCPLVGDQRREVEITEDEYDAGVLTAPHDFRHDMNGDAYYQYVPSCEIIFQFQGGGTHGNHDAANMYVHESGESLMNRVAAIESRRSLHRLRDRGEWEAGEQYHALDFVTKPGTTDTFLAMADSKSSSVGVLSNAALWCGVTVPGA